MSAEKTTRSQDGFKLLSDMTAGDVRKFCEEANGARDLRRASPEYRARLERQRKSLLES